MEKQVALLLILILYQVDSEKNVPSVFKSIQPRFTPSKSRIIGGEEVVPHSVPYQVAVHINGNSYCGGALISPNYVLTAAHCGIVIWIADVILGAHNLTDQDEETRVVIKVNQTILHEKYNNTNLHNDIALLKLSEPAPINNFIQTIPLPHPEDSNRSYQDEIASATGWGLPRDVPYPSTRDMSDVLLKVDVPVSNLTECKIYYNDEDGDYVYNTNICTSGYRNRGTCDGDSGGPLTLRGVLIGITSFGTTQCEMCSPSVYTRMTDYLHWIVEHSDVYI